MLSSPHMHTLYVAHSMSTWAVPSAGTGLAYMSLHVSRARLHESLSSADYLLGKSKVNKRKVRITAPALAYAHMLTHWLDPMTARRLDRALSRALFNDPGRLPGVLCELDTVPSSMLTGYAASQAHPASGCDGLGRCGRPAAWPRLARFHRARSLVGDM